jgi:transaldolase
MGRGGNKHGIRLPAPRTEENHVPDNTYLSWVINHTKTKWWHDSAEQSELDTGLARGAVGVTTNPFLSNIAVNRNRKLFESEINAVLSRNLPAEQKAEALMRIIVTRCAEKLIPEYERSGAKMGYVCGQVNPNHAGNREVMLAMARRFTKWAPNIAVKLPATAAGLDVLEDCVAEGITCTATVSFTVPQAVVIAEKHCRGAERARQAGITPGKCFAVIMIGRLDDYLREVAADNQAHVTEADIRQSGLAATKRAYQIYQERGYDAVLLVAALRGDYHLTELAGADLVMSIHPVMQPPFIDKDHPREERIGKEVPKDVIDRLRTMPEFLRAYEPDGMAPEEFVSYGVTQRTICQFIESGWKLLETYQ